MRSFLFPFAAATLSIARYYTNYLNRPNERTRLPPKYIRISLHAYI